MYTTHQSFSSTQTALPMLRKPVARRRKLVRAVRPAPYRVTAPNSRGNGNGNPNSNSNSNSNSNGNGISPAVGQISLLDSTPIDIAVLDLMYFHGRLTSDGGAEWQSPSVHNLRGYGSGNIQRPLATWDPEDFESDFDRSCESRVAVCAMADADRRRFPMRALG